MKRRCLVSLALTIAWAIAALQAAGPIALSVPGRANAHVSVAAEGSFVVLVWSASTEKGATDVYAAISHDNGDSFAAPIRVNSTAGDARTNGEQPPRVTLVPRAGLLPEIAVLWTTRRGEFTMLLTARSSDGGRTFGRSAVVPGSDAAGNRGWETIGAAATGEVFAVWLDHRRIAEQQQQAQATGAHQHGGMDPQLSQLYFARLDGRSAPMGLTGGVCYCCKTAMAVGREGQIHLAWRHVYPGNLRDIAFISSRDRGRSFGAPIRISEDQWAIEGCPEDGPSLVVDTADRVHAVWPTVVTEGGGPVKALFHAMSRDGRSFSPRTRLPTEGQANHPQIALSSDGSIAVVWDETGSGTRRLAFARGMVDPEGRARFQRQSSADVELGAYPVVAYTAGGLLTAWTSGPPDHSVIRVIRQ